MFLRRSVKRTQQCAALHPGALLDWIDPNRAHRGEIDHQAVIRHPETEHAVSAAAHADLEVEIAGRPNSCPHSRDMAAAKDQAWAPVDRRVPHRARRVIPGVSRSQDVAIDGLRQAFLDHGSSNEPSFTSP